MKYTPENITELKKNQVFCYGANTAGRHGLGAAKLALKWGAKYREYGFDGQTYGIPTKDSNIETLPLEEINYHVQIFIHFAEQVKKLEFLVTKIGMGLAGLKLEDIAPLFQTCILKENIILPKEFHDFYNN